MKTTQPHSTRRRCQRRSAPWGSPSSLQLVVLAVLCCGACDLNPRVHFATDRPGAVLYINNVIVQGATPTSIKLPEGTHRATLFTDGSVPDFFEFEVKGRNEITVSRTLQTVEAAISSGTGRLRVAELFDQLCLVDAAGVPCMSGKTAAASLRAAEESERQRVAAEQRRQRELDAARQAAQPMLDAYLEYIQVSAQIYDGMSGWDPRLELQSELGGRAKKKLQAACGKPDVQRFVNYGLRHVDERVNVALLNIADILDESAKDGPSLRGKYRFEGALQNFVRDFGQPTYWLGGKQLYYGQARAQVVREAVKQRGHSLDWDKLCARK